MDVLKKIQSSSPIVRNSNLILKAFGIEKARSGIYADNPVNRKLKRVGQKYGSKKQEQGPQRKIKKPEQKKYDRKKTEEYAKKATDEQLKIAANKHKDPMVMEVAKKEIESRKNNSLLDKINSLSDEQVKNYLQSSNKEVSNIAEKVLKDRNIDFINKEDVDLVYKFMKDNNIDISTMSNVFRGITDYETIHNFYNFLGGKENIGKINKLEIYKLGKDELEINLKSDNFEDLHRIYNFKDKKIINFSLRLNEKVKSKGLGTKIFKHQIDTYKKQGYKKVLANAIKNESSNGYYTWARLGYEIDGERGLKNFNDLVKSSDDDKIKSVKSLSELMLFDKGRKFWRDFGFAFNGIFDLSNKSNNIEILNNYINEKGKNKK